MTTRIASVRAELRSDSADVATATPRLSWTTVSETPGWSQQWAEMKIEDEVVARVDGPGSVLVPWPFEPLRSRSVRTVQVRVLGSDGLLSDWSEPCRIRAAFRSGRDWVAPLIAAPEPTTAARPVLLRTEFTVRPQLRRATLYATAHGVYQAFVNGHEVDDQVLKPGWTPYRSRIVHESTDVTALLATGANALGIDLAGGWYTERVGFMTESGVSYGEQPSVTVHLELEYVDGSTDDVLSGEQWRCTTEGPRRSASLYDGEEYDARREMPGWDRPGFDDSAWSAAHVLRENFPVPEARTSPAVRAIERMPVTRVLNSRSGKQILDFGQNVVGRLRIRLTGPAGTRVVTRHAEVLEDGELGVRPLRSARATNTYVLSGNGEEIWEPAFTFQGFRYAEVTGLPEPIDPAAAEVVVLHSDLRRTGFFESSHPLINQLHANVVRSMRGNFFYLPTDCPQRDERLGWTGDIQVFAPTAAFLYDVDAFLASWLVDLGLEQDAIGTGSVPFTVPHVISGGDEPPGEGTNPTAAWGDAATVVPAVLFERYGDREVLERQFTSMCAWVGLVQERAGQDLLWAGDFQFGDWLDPTAPPEDAFRAMTSPDLVATAYFHRSALLTSRTAMLLGRPAQAQRYSALAYNIHRAFVDEYVGEDALMSSDSQTAYALGIVFGLHDSPQQRDRMGERLASLVRENNFRIGTGFVGTSLVCDALTETGQLEVLDALVTSTSNPSWLYPVTMGATSIWERWDSMLEDGSINPGEMTSFNHYALGAIADWLHRRLAGLAPGEPGYRTLEIAPVPLPSFDHARADLHTPYGTASAGWRRDGDVIVVEATVPTGTTATVRLPGRESVEVASGHHVWKIDG
ncbi:glycoside hydrolase family 78 protein [Kineosporia mesophila]|uniref:alpha-L-rhamnosidase n=1 Tax=Kineosporia mesophila TaxID=566012 RepID=A0ABP7ABT7_9ACTN|nr:alpha-L-rhamnosidase [Kineosporia mesophila]MCD5351304.1 glycoside hydrolase family 78 protein [Kineosporia mesophila]